MAETVFLRYPCPKSLRRLPTDNFGQRQRPGGGTYQRPEGHGGSDIKPSVSGKTGEPVHSVRPGKVVFVGEVGESSKWGDDYGKRVLIEHKFEFKGRPFTRYSFYAHLSKVRVKAGDSVAIDKPIGELGNTGHSTGPHVHFEWHSAPHWREGLIDPFPRLNEIRQKELAS